MSDCACKIPTSRYGITSGGCGPNIGPAIALSGWPGDIARLVKNSSTFVGWAGFSALFASSGTTQTIMDLKAAANCQSIELIQNLSFTANNPQVIAFIDRMRITVSPGAVEIPATDLAQLRQSLYLYSKTPNYDVYVNGLQNTRTLFRGSASAVGPTAAAAWLTLDRPAMDLHDDRTPPMLVEFANDPTFGLVSRLNLASAGTLRYTVELHGAWVGQVTGTIRARLDECNSDGRGGWPANIGQYLRFLAGQAQGLDGAGGVELPRQV